jgi:hypothetical protein
MKTKGLKYAIFIEPEGLLREHILAQKKSLERQFESPIYCSHPPHCTLIVGRYCKPQAWLGELRCAVGSIEAFDVHTHGYHVFYDDAIAGGGHTVVVRVDLSPALLGLQQCVADLFSSKRNNPEGLSDCEIFPAGPLRRSCERFGFPFVGAHWIPHFTIASMKVTRDAKFLKSMISMPAVFTTHVSRVSLWEVNGDWHKRLFVLRLKS